MKQPKINGRQARWLVYLTPYDFIIKHRPGLLNPANGLSRRPDYKAQREPSQIQSDLLANRLVESNSGLSKSLPSLPLHKMVAPMLIKNQVGSILSQKSLPCLPLHEIVAPMLAA